MSITRTSNQSMDLPPLMYTLRNNYGSFSSAPKSNQSSINWINSVTVDENIPDWRERIAKGEHATTKLVGTKLVTSRTPWSAALLEEEYKHSPTIIERRTHELYGPMMTPVVPVHDTALLTETLLAGQQGFYNKILKSQRSLQSLVAVGEFGQTLKMMKHPVKSLYNGVWDYLDTLKKRTRKRSNRKSKKQIIADTWLENAFGWQPLINDVVDLAEGLAKLHGRNPPTKRINYKAGRNKKYAPTPPVVSYYPDSSNRRFSVTVSYIQTNSVLVRYSGVVRLHVDSSQGITDTLGLRLRDIVPTLWELVPYSFLVDYFTNVGNIINNASIQTSDVSWADENIEIITTSKYSIPSCEFLTSPGATLIKKYFNGGEQTFISRRYVKRDGFGVGGNVPLTFEIPGLRDKKWLNIAALIAGSKRTSKELSAY